MPIRKRFNTVPSVSEQIRALDREGLSRSEIARKLGKRYQHVWNVLEADASKATVVEAPPSPVESEDVHGDLHLTVREDGSVLLPPAVRDKLGYAPGGKMVGEWDGERLVIYSWEENIRRVQAWARSLVPDGRNVVDELIAEGREAAARGD